MNEDSFLGETVFITGGTGFMGSLLVKKLLEYGVERVVTYSRRWEDSEKLQREVRDSRLHTVNGDIRDKYSLEVALSRFNPDTIIHAAAYKSVPSAAENPLEAISVNIQGTINLVNTAKEYDIKKLCLISTDKACAAINVYGKSKAIAEAYVSSIALLNPGLRYFSVRYGNVVGSSGSVFQIFDKAEKYLVTNPDMTRFWFRKNSAVEFVLDSIERARGGEVFVPYLSSSTMMDFTLAFQSIQLKDYVVVGERKEEKLHEKMISGDEMPNAVWLNELNVFAILPQGMRIDDSIPAKDFLNNNNFSSFSTRRYTQEELVKLINEYLNDN